MLIFCLSLFSFILFAVLFPPGGALIIIYADKSTPLITTNPSITNIVQLRKMRLSETLSLPLASLALLGYILFEVRNEAFCRKLN
jgi:hypothetical protein